jgi:tetratricopeptide (TPR) repeat protein
MYEAITGKAPLVGSNVLETMQKQIHERPEDLFTVRPDLYIPDKLTEILFKAMEKEPDKRYQSMQELRQDLGSISRLLAGKPQVSGARLPRFKEGQTARTKARSEFRLISLCLLGLVALILVIVTISRSVPRAQIEHSKKPATYALLQAPEPSSDPKDAWAKYRQAAAKALKDSAFYQAEVALQASIKQANKLPDKDSCTAYSLLDLTRVYMAQKRWTEAEHTAKKALELKQKLGQSNDSSASDIYLSLGSIHLAGGRFQQADSYLRRALAIEQRELGSTSPQLVGTMNTLGKVSEGERNYNRAEAYYKQALAIGGLAPSPSAAQLSETLSDYARLLRHLHRDTEAQKLEARIQALATPAKSSL